MNKLEMTWDEIETLSPGASAAWDRDGGDAWWNGRGGLTIGIICNGLCAGCGEQAPYGWAFYDDKNERWSFI